MAELIERFKMETNFEGLIQLLAKNLYTDPDVFIRELVQNAHDGIIRRHEIERDLGGRIDVKCDYAESTITVTDNGIGMDQADIKQFLAVIGSTGTGTARKRLEAEGRQAAYDLIGQFGIGMLSAYVVAEKVVVRTRKLGAMDAFAWHNTGSAECDLFADDKPEIGTTIEVKISQEYGFMLDDKHLREAIIKYCDLIPFEIYLNSQGPINTVDAPWHRQHWRSEAEKEASYRLLLSRRYSDTPLDIIPVEIDEPFRARGALYISDRHVPDVNTTGVIDIFVRRIFVRGDDNTLLPPWAKFVRGVIDSPDLEPTAARDNVQRTRPAFLFLQKRLGELIVERLGYLARFEPNKFKQINIWHHYHLKGMAFFHDDFFQQVADLLLFETNRGPMALKDYLTKNAPRPDIDNRAPIYYFAYNGAAAQFYRLADARGWVVINAGWSFDEELLEKYAQLNHRTTRLERLDATDDAELFQRLDTPAQEHFRQLELDMEGYLRRFDLPNVAVRMRRFAPAELPAVIILTPESQAELNLRNVVTQPWFLVSMEEVAQEALRQTRRRPIYLSLNSDNPLIQKLADADRRDQMVQEVMLGVYNSAILYSQNLLTQSNANIIHGQVVRVLDRLMTQKDHLSNTMQTLEQERRQMIELRQHQAPLVKDIPEHILLFMITPYADEYRPLEDAVRSIFERPPYCFQVQLARDYTHKSGLLDNVREHMARAHGFIAEISDQSPNVMFEVGAVMMWDDTRPVFTLRRRDAKLPVPADFKEKLFIEYGSPSDSIVELETDIRKAFEKDGRITHGGIQELLSQRKARFLSRKLLENLEVRLNSAQINSLMKQHSTVESILDLTEDEFARSSGLPKYLVPAIQGALREV